jgi:hypothetical protein
VYFGFFGGSALLHLLAAHPKVVAALGVATTVAMLVTSVGPGNYLGAGQQMRRLEGSIVAQELVDDRDVAAAQRMVLASSASLEHTVRGVLRACGQGCSDLTPILVMNDPSLLERVLYVAQLDLQAQQQGAARDRIAEFFARR